jgi:hypothetical protein
MLHQVTTAVLPPLHLLAYSTLLGTTLYQTFIVTKITFDALPRSAFTTLQRKLFPAYFRCQAGLLVLTALTVPRGVVEQYSPVMAWVPFAIAGISCALNVVVFGPGTQRVMVERIHQGKFVRLSLGPSEMMADFHSAIETREGGRKPADAEVSLEMQKLNRAFRRQHAMSIHLNLLCIGAMLWWGVRLASRLGLEMPKSS